MSFQRTAILGGGIAGLCIAEKLSRTEGRAIEIYDPSPDFPPSDNASALAGGMLAPWSEIEYLPADWREAAFEGIRFWRDLSPRQEEIGFHNTGCLVLCHKHDSHMLARFTALFPSENPPYQSLTSQDLQALEPQLALFDNALFFQDEACLHPQKAIAYLAALIKKRNVSIINKKADPETLGNTYDMIIDCRGMGASTQQKSLRGVKGEILSIRNEEFKLHRPVRLMHPRYPFYIVPHDDGVYRIGATIIESSGAAGTSVRSALELLSAAYSLHPSFAEAEILSLDSALRPAYPDNLPHIARQEQVIYCNGLFRHGYLLAPVMADCVADMLDGRDNRFMSLFIGGEILP